METRRGGGEVSRQSPRADRCCEGSVSAWFSEARQDVPAKRPRGSPQQMRIIICLFAKRSNKCASSSSACFRSEERQGGRVACPLPIGGREEGEAHAERTCWGALVWKSARRGQRVESGKCAEKTCWRGARGRRRVEKRTLLERRTCLRGTRGTRGARHEKRMLLERRTCSRGVRRSCCEIDAQQGSRDSFSLFFIGFV